MASNQIAMASNFQPKSVSTASSSHPNVLFTSFKKAFEIHSKHAEVCLENHPNPAISFHTEEIRSMLMNFDLTDGPTRRSDLARQTASLPKLALAATRSEAFLLERQTVRKTRHLLLVAWHLFLRSLLVITSKALVPSSDALVPSSEHGF